MLLLSIGCTAPDSIEADAPLSLPRFTEITDEAGLGDFKHETGGLGQSLMPEIVGGGGGFIDYNDDGWPDILLVAGGTWAHLGEAPVQGLYLYRNNGDGSFTDQTEAAGLANEQMYGFGASVADYDNDGDDDFFVTTLHQNKLYRNDDGRFSEVGVAAGFVASVWSTSAVFFDANRDGWLDIYVGNYVDWSPEKDLTCMHEDQKVFCTPQEYTGRASHYYQNDGDGTFSNRSREAGFWTAVDTTKDKTLGVTVFDFNEDGWPDITTGNDTENDMLFENKGDGTFREVGLQSGIAVSQHGFARAGMGIDAGVVDSSGLVSIFVGNFSEESVSVFRYSGNGQFQDRSAVSRVAFPSNLTLTFGLALLDVDQDTDLDLLTANGHVLTHINKISQAVQFKQAPQLYLNRGNGVFDEMKALEGPLTTPMVARGLATSDIDLDGDIDVLFIENGGPVHLWRNDTVTRSYLSIKLEGTESNRDGLGTHVIASVFGLDMKRWARTGYSFLVSSDKTVVFGLGQHNKVDTLRVEWPSGQVDTFIDIDANQEIHIKEGQKTFNKTTNRARLDIQQ